MMNLRKCGITLTFLTVMGPAMSSVAANAKVDPTGVNGHRNADPPALSPISHVVIILKQNRSFDEYFGQFPGADGATTAARHDGTVVPLAQTPDPGPNDIAHSNAAFLKAYNNGLMNGFDLVRGAYSSTGFPFALSQMSESQIPNYWAYARRYGLADHFFAPWQGSSFPNGVFSVAAQAGQYDPSLGGRTIYWNPYSPSMPVGQKWWGCDSLADTTVQMIDPATKTITRTFPCFNFPSVVNTLASAGISWHFYNTTGQQSVYDPFDALTPVRNNPALWSQVVPTAQFFSDAAAGNLPAVSWIVGGSGEHPPGSACMGENQTVSYVNAIMKQPTLWASTAVFVFWDEWGGFYDHVPPPQSGDGISFGFRVPFLLISPYSKVGQSSDGGSVSSTNYSHLSVLRFIEDNWGLPSLTPKDGAANSLMDMFDFTGATRKSPLILTQRTCPPLTAAQQAQVDVQGD